MTRHKADRIALYKMSEQEQRVFNELLRGKSPAEIAKKLRTTLPTVTYYTNRIYKMYGTNTRAKLMAYFVVPPTPPTP